MISLLRRLLRHPPPAPQGSLAYNVGWDAHFTPIREERPMHKRQPTRRAWNGGSPEAAMAEARRRTEAAIASGCPRCPACRGEGMFRDPPRVCDTCGAAGYLVPEGGMPLPAAKSS